MLYASIVIGVEAQINKTNVQSASSQCLLLSSQATKIYEQYMLQDINKKWLNAFLVTRDDIFLMILTAQLYWEKSTVQNESCHAVN